MDLQQWLRLKVQLTRCEYCRMTLDKQEEANEPEALTASPSATASENWLVFK